jgi:multisubunit Na+/H+ antiporter MnhB subunit
MLSTGQIIFAICFLIAFIIIMIISYRKDRKLHKKQFKGSVWILVGFIVFVLFLLAVKLYFKD